MSNNHNICAVKKVLQCENLIQEIKTFVNSNNLLNARNLLTTTKKSCYDWKLTSDATSNYYENDEFQSKLHSLVSDSSRQILLNKNVREILLALKYILLIFIYYIIL